MTEERAASAAWSPAGPQPGPRWPMGEALQPSSFAPARNEFNPSFRPDGMTTDGGLAAAARVASQLSCLVSDDSQHDQRNRSGQPVAGVERPVAVEPRHEQEKQPGAGEDAEGRFACGF
jgi:hypothetical protein